MKRDAIERKLTELGILLTPVKQILIPTEEELLNLQNMDGDELLSLLGKISYEINENGGLQKYQTASMHGQETQRGSDSSKWLFDTVPELKTLKPRALEIGCLSTKNVISRYCEVMRIDLNSNEPAIIKQDFMDLKPEKFGLVSCSLVLNFVPTPQKRGEMIQRFRHFLNPDGYLFIVLPLSCLTNSRYCDMDLFVNIMQTQGFKERERHEAKKLVYLCFKLVGQPVKTSFPKRKIHDGKTMNNFCITL